jgi:peptidoglycan/xylan/chitin deacetylase (PgdA/CDA1 family)
MSQSSPDYPKSYREIRHLDARAIARSMAVNILATWAFIRGKYRAGLMVPRVHILCLHHLFPDEEPRFRQLLRSLSQQHEFVGYSDAIDRIRNGSFSKPFLAITFDDGFLEVARAAKIMDEFGAKGCFFLCPPIVGESNPEIIRDFCLRGLRINEQRQFLTWRDVDQLLSTGHEVGAHTMTHPNLRELHAGSLQHEIAESREVLTKRCGSIRHFAWPFGRFENMSRDSIRAVFEAGFETCASAERGCHVAKVTGRPEQFCVRRENTVAGWNPFQTLFFLSRSALRSGPVFNEWPTFLAEASNHQN